VETEVAMTDGDPLTLQHTGEGYEYVRCRANGDDATVYIHRLLFVAEHGVDELPAGWHVHHEVSIPWLNLPSNLSAVDPDDHGRHHLQNVPLSADGGRVE
jgi:hypothetical protein